MNIAGRDHYVFDKYRSKQEGAIAFMKGKVPGQHIQLLIEIAQEESMDFLTVVQYYYAMFNSLQDLVNMHHPIILNGVHVEIMNRRGSHAFIKEMRSFFTEPYLKNAGMAFTKVKRLKGVIRKIEVGERKKEAIIAKKKADWAKETKRRLAMLKKEKDKQRRQKIKRWRRRNAIGLY